MQIDKEKKATVTMGVQAGSVAAFDATQPHYGPLRNLLTEHCVGPYSSEVDEFYLVLRIDGDIGHWEKEGCDRLRRSRKTRYITVDIYVPRERWEGVSGIEIRKYLAVCAGEALRLMIDKLRRDKSPIEGEALLRDFEVVKERYLALAQEEAMARA